MERRFTLPAALNWGAAEDVNECDDGGRADNVGGREIAEDSETGVRGEAEVEAYHGALGEDVRHTSKPIDGEADLRACELKEPR